MIMATIVTPISHKTVNQLKLEFLASIPDGQLMCRATHFHPFPSLDPRDEDLPIGISALPQKDGCWQMNETCPNCGKVRWYTTLPGGWFDLDVLYQYKPPRDWVTLPADSPFTVTARDYKSELFRRNIKKIAKRRAGASASRPKAARPRKSR
jgi:hypothetical protein